MMQRPSLTRSVAGGLGARVGLVLLTLILTAAAHAQTVVDQIITLVNNEMITRSDLLWSIALDPDAPSPQGPISSDVLRQKLDVLIDQRLIAQEAARMPGAEVSKAEVEKAKGELVGKFPSEAVFRTRMESVGLSQARIDELMRQRVAINKFIDFRFRSFVFVSEQDARTYYDDRLAPEIRKEGRIPPPLDQVRDKILDVLKQQKVNEEIDRFLREARQRADIVQLADL
jgi:hypothetical protein